MDLLLKIYACLLVGVTVSPMISAQVAYGLEDSYLPNPTDCGSFYQCTNGVPKLQECAPDHNGGVLVFDPRLQVCVFPHNYDCQIFACHRYNDVNSCLNSPNNCSYCCDRLNDDDISRCGTYDDLLQNGCTAFEHSDYNSQVDANSTCVILSPGRKRNITITFSLEKHPMVLYYLMDTTGSMADDKDNLVSLSSHFIDTLLNLTNDFHIGFGTFKDKPMFPSNPDDYSFRNDLPLTSRTEDFVEQIIAAKISGGGGDGPEACGDALTQVIECPERIGWRGNTRRVLLVATDDLFHVAGKGQLFNITAPYIEGCYLDADGFYTQSMTMDFPSIEQLGSAYSRIPTTTVIFATSYGIDFYQNVASHFKSAYVGALASDSSNIVELIRDEFARIDSKIEIEKSVTTDTVYFKYYSNCMDTDGDERETAICENIPATGEVTFTVEIDFPECPVDEYDTTGMYIDFSPVGLPAFIEVKLSFLCG